MAGSFLSRGMSVILRTSPLTPHLSPRGPEKQCPCGPHSPMFSADKVSQSTLPRCLVECLDGRTISLWFNNTFLLLLAFWLTSLCIGSKLLLNSYYMSFKGRGDELLLFTVNSLAQYEFFTMYIIAFSL